MSVSRQDRVWIQGAGELASGIALRLFRCGYRILMAEVATPRAVRRLVSFSEAVYSGRTQVEEVTGRLFPAAEGAFTSGEVNVVVDPEGRQIPRVQPSVLVDARMTKQKPQALPAPGIPIVGLGPGFLCERDVVYIIETHREARLGAVIAEGEAMANTGVPGPVGGQAEGRLLRSPAAGRLQPLRRLGDLVESGETVGLVAELPVRARIGGLLRGLVHPRVELSAGEKVGDIEPRGGAVDPALVSDKALAVAGGVLEALLRLGVLPCTRQ